MEIVNPFTGDVIEDVPADTAATIKEKVRKAQIGQKIWAGKPYQTRHKAIQKLNEMIQKESGRLAKVLTAETGKPITQSRNEITALKGRIDFFLNNTEEMLQEETVLREEGLAEKITWEPLGVIANISAWNYPYFVGSNVFIPALLTGNAVLYKPSEYSTMTGIEISKLMEEAGVLADAFIPVIGQGEVGAELLAQQIDGAYFTGSYSTGLKIAEAAAKGLYRFQLELGGKDPIYVTEDVDVKTAAESIADGAFYNCGQSCCSVERIYVASDIYDEFVKHFVGTVEGFVIGDPSDEKTYIGPLTRLEQIKFLEEQIKEAVGKGAKVLTGGKRKEGNFFQPTVLTQVNHEMAVMREESFGPVIGIMKVADDPEAIQMMNDTVYGLTAGVFSANEQRAKGILEKLNAGSVYWNCCDRVSPNLPWTGRGHSGLGSTLSKIGIRAFLEPKAWHLRKP